MKLRVVWDMHLKGIMEEEYKQHIKDGEDMLKLFQEEFGDDENITVISVEEIDE